MCGRPYATADTVGHMTKWEYETKFTNGEELARVLAAQGENGWELVSVVHTARFALFFKRPVLTS